VHELSIAREIIVIVEDEMTRLNLNRVITVYLRIGALAAINPDALTFGFETSVANTRLEGARAVIDIIPVKGRCQSCHKEFEIEKFMFVCPHCGSSKLKITAGEELEIDHLVGE
jgi:hydrogenase nickel incorporation protein HypA/HybF